MDRDLDAPLRMEIIDDRSAELLRKMTPLERLRKANEIFLFGKDLWTAGTKLRHPDWDAVRIHQEWTRMLNHGPA